MKRAQRLTQLRQKWRHFLGSEAAQTEAIQRQGLGSEWTALPFAHSDQEEEIAVAADITCSLGP